MRVAVAVMLSAGLMSLLQPAIPPVKMGLWETTEVATMTMPPKMAEQMKGTGMAPGAPITTKKRVCYTPEVWEKALGIKPVTDDCKVSNRSISGKMASMTVTCTVGGVPIASDIALTFDSSEAWHGTGHTVSTFPANLMGGGKMTTETTLKSVYKGSSCGAVSPDHPEVVE